MEYFLQDLLISIWDSGIWFYNSSLFLFIKIILGIYLAVVILDIILILILFDVPSQMRVGLRGMDVPLVTKSKMQKRWDKIKDRLKTGNISQYKVAIIEADALADEILGGIGYKGANMTEKLEQIEPTHIDDHLESLKGAHQVRNRIVHEENFEIDARLTKAVLDVYENFLKYLEYLK